MNNVNANQQNEFEEYVKQVERDLLGHIHISLRDNKMSTEDAKKLAQEFLTLLPFKDKEDLLDKLHGLGVQYREAMQTYADFGVPFEEEERQRKLIQMREHIKNGDIDRALNVVKGVNNYA